MWHYSEVGSGRPLILLHGIGMSHSAWNPVVPLLSGERRTIAFDIAGFGDTPALPEGEVPTIPNLVEGLAESMREMGLEGPVDIAGNSLGGYIALEAAKRGLARSVVAISPAGLWRQQGSAHVKYVFKGLRFGARVFPRMARAMLQRPLLREVMLAVPLSVGCRRMPAEDAVRAMDDLSRATAFDVTFANTGAFSGGRNISVPLTVAFGARDWILPASSQLRDELPESTRWIRKKGWGHVPMWADPSGVAELILEGTQ